MGLPECEVIYDAIDQSKKDPAVKFLQDCIPPEVKSKIRAVIANDPVHWFADYHLSWGMGVRNALRKVGYGEAHFGVKNLDDIYVELVEEALMSI